MCQVLGDGEDSGEGDPRILLAWSTSGGMRFLHFMSTSGAQENSKDSLGPPSSSGGTSQINRYGLNRATREKYVRILTHIGNRGLRDPELQDYSPPHVECPHHHK